MKILSSAFPLTVVAAVVLTISIGGLAGAQGVSTSSTLKFMTYNVQAPGWNATRRAQVVGTIDAEMPDVLGLHEATPFSAGPDLLADLSDDYEPHHTGTANPIYLRLDRNFIVLDEGVLVLPTCSVFGNFTVAWVKVVTQEGAPFDFYNAHFCVSQTPSGAGDPIGNQMQAVATAEFMDANSAPGVGILAGDLNAGIGSPTIDYLLDGVPLVFSGQPDDNPIELDDTWETANRDSGVMRPGTTANGGFNVLDWIMSEPSVCVLDAEVIQFNIPAGQQSGFSDHLPVTATFELWPRGQANSTAARLEVNGVGAGVPAGPFGVKIPSVGASLDFSWSGPPNAPGFLIAGARNPAHVSPGGIGTLDIGTPPFYTDLISLAGFVLDGSGAAQQSFLNIPSLPVGSLVNLQGLVGQPAGSASDFVLTATHYLEVIL